MTIIIGYLIIGLLIGKGFMKIFPDTKGMDQTKDATILTVITYILIMLFWPLLVLKLLRMKFGK